MLQGCNGLLAGLKGLSEMGNLPKMKPQPSQLPQIVGSGRVAVTRPFFLREAPQASPLAELRR